VTADISAINVITGVLHADAGLHPKSWNIVNNSLEWCQNRGILVGCSAKPKQPWKTERARPLSRHQFIPSGRYRLKQDCFMLDFGLLKCW